MLAVFAFLFQLSLSLQEKVPKLIKEGESVGNRINNTNVAINEDGKEFSNLDYSNENGAAINIDKQRVNCTLTNCKFNFCKAKNGGAIYIYYAGKKYNYTFEISGSTFSNCESLLDGGAIYVKNTQEEQHFFYLKDCTFTKNKAGNNGGAIYAEVRDSLQIANCNFNNNQVASSNYNGSSIYCKLGWIQNVGDSFDELNLTKSTFTFTPDENNLINIYIKNNCNIECNSNPIAEVFIGGCIFSANSQSSTEFKHLLIDSFGTGFKSVNFVECNCVRQGKNTVQIPTKFTLENFNFDCKGDTCTPGEVIPGVPDVTAPPAVVPPTDNGSDEGYDVVTEKVEKNMENVTVTIRKSSFRNLKDTSANGGGAVLVQRSNITIEDSKFISNEATKGGGAINIYLTRNDEINGVKYRPPLFCTIIRCKFMSCTADFGGAAYLRSTQPNIHSITVEDCTFASNTASKYGGAIYTEARDEFLMQRCIFYNNNASEGSSIWLTVGNAAGSDTNDTAILLDNQFVAHQDSLSNVYIKSVKITSETLNAHASIIIGGCTFNALNNPTNSEYKNLKMVEGCDKGFQSITFTGCNCFMQDSNTVSIPSKFSITNVQFKCSSIDTCKPGSVAPPEIVTPTPAPTPDTDKYIPSNRIFAPKEKVDLTKYKFTSLVVNENGAAIFMNDTGRASCSLVNCKFDSCHAQNGGALYLDYATKNKYVLFISGCQFNKCEADQNGGAIYLSSTQSNLYSLSIVSTTFTSNKAGSEGGAVYLSVRDNFTMKQCIFTDNEAAQKGSSLWCQVGWQNGAVNNIVSFTDNTFTFAPKAGSVNVYFTNKMINASKNNLNAGLVLGMSRFSTRRSSNVDFKHLEITNSGDGFQQINFADCVCVQQGSETVSLPEGLSAKGFTYNCNSYESCQPSEDGYKYHSRVEDVERTEPINLEGYKFVSLEDTTEGKGPAIIVYKHRTSLTVKNCKFESCYSSQFGGAVYVQYSGSNNDTYICTISNSIFNNNEAKTNGGALYCYITQSNTHSITVSHCTFNSNQVGKNGGAVYALVRDSFTLEHCTFNNNDAKGLGASVWLRIGDKETYNVNEAFVTDNSFTFSPKYAESVNVYFESSTLSDDTTPNANLILSKNIFDTVDATTTEFLHVSVVAPSEFESIRSEGCNCVKQGSKTVSLPFSYNPEILFNFDCQSLDQCTTKQPTPAPTADADGYIPSQRIELNVAPTLTLSNTKFVGIENDKEGGAVSLTKVSCRFTQCKFDKCKTKYNEERDNGGGAIYLSYVGKDSANYTAIIANCDFNNCEATTYGGAINIHITQPDSHSVNIQGCTFANNKAGKSGGAIYAIGRDLLTIQHSKFTNNEAANGSSLWVTVGWYNKKAEDGDQFNLYGNTFEFKPSQTNPINVYVKSNKLNEGFNPNANIFIGHCTFIASNIDGNSQKHLVVDEDGTFQSLVFTECNCIQGAENTVSINAASKPNLENAFHYNCNNIDQCPSGSEKPPASGECSSYENRRELYGNEFTIKNSCFYNLKSATSREGGAIRAVNTKLEVEDCRFKSCSSGNDGGAIYVCFTIKGCEFELEKCTFEDCSSSSQGGAVFFDNNFVSESSIEDCKFINNKASQNGGALYYAPCGNSKLSKCFFVNNSCTSSDNIRGSSIYVYIQNLNSKSALKNLKLQDDDDNKVVIEGNRFRSQPVEGAQQMYINLKKTGNLQLGENAFSFNGVKEAPKDSKYIQVRADEGAQLAVTGEICVDSTQTDLISGIDSNIKYDCHRADQEFDSQQPGGKKGKKNVGMIVGIVVAVVVVIVVVVVVVVVVLRKKKSTQYISDLADDVDNQSGPVTNNDPEMAT
ncbi:hypothetical protein M9Y10_037297 [Tritrichomonas musculus]|uniref:Polymorphic outer membrane protein repeat-containing protein n=1 Tax=Tritrichomonas musculus TaxID=1915356 RepID=A0ABR2GS55_9EUKA